VFAAMGAMQEVFDNALLHLGGFGITVTVHLIICVDCQVREFNGGASIYFQACPNFRYWFTASKEVMERAGGMILVLDRG
jgi:hypothetical protein